LRIRFHFDTFAIGQIRRLTQMSIFRRSCNLVLAVALVLGGTGCSSESGSSAPEREFSMGTLVAVGGLTYTVIDQRWAEALPSSTGVRLPKERFLIIGISVTNGGGATAGIPLLTLVGSDGKEYQEETKGDGISNWLGYIRILEPAQTEHGRLLFDVPPGVYKLRVSSGGEPEDEVTALVTIPFRIETPSSVGEDTLTTPAQ
jgi:hypothetical protein